jgi:hypothetical protein
MPFRVIAVSRLDALCDLNAPLSKTETGWACLTVQGPAKQRGRRESNPQPPDRQSGTLTN